MRSDGGIPGKRQTCFPRLYSFRRRCDYSNSIYLRRIGRDKSQNAAFWSDKAFIALGDFAGCLSFENTQGHAWVHSVINPIHEYEGRTELEWCSGSVSYTHLDVYKRQVLALLKHRGAANVAVIEPVPERGTVAESMGATVVIDPAAANLDREIGCLTGNRGMDVIFECAGLAETIREACGQGAAGAKVVVLGICYQPVELNFLNLVTQEINIITAFGKTTGEFREAAGLIAGGLVDMSPLITGIVPVAEVAKAFHQPSRGKIKNLVVF